MSIIGRKKERFLKVLAFCMVGSMVGSLVFQAVRSNNSTVTSSNEVLTPISHNALHESSEFYEEYIQKDEFSHKESEEAYEESEQASNVFSDDESNEVSDEVSNEISNFESVVVIEGFTEVSYEESNEASDEVYENFIEESNEDSYTESAETFEDEDEDDDDELSYTNYEDYEAIPYTAEDLFKFEATMTVECGAQGISREVIIADCWIARNHIEKEIADESADPFRAALNPDHFQPVYDDEFGWRVMHGDEPVTQELIDQNPTIHEISVAVLNGEIPSPIGDWGCCLPYDYFGFDDGDSFAEAAGIIHYIIIENGVFFPASDWTEMCTWFCQNF